MNRLQKFLIGLGLAIYVALMLLALWLFWPAWLFAVLVFVGAVGVIVGAAALVFYVFELRKEVFR